jgi:branched-chain amino acid transport system substrate-binding protein
MIPKNGGGHVVRGIFVAVFMLLPLVAQAEDYTIDVIEPMSGNAAFVGRTHEAALHLLEGIVNQDGGVLGRPLRLVFHDDQTSPQTAVQIATEIVSRHPPVMLGSSIVAMCSAVMPLLKNGPFDYCLSPGMRPPAGSYMFSIGVNTQILMQGVFDFFRKNGWTRIGTISSTDATGQEIEQGFDAALKLPENAGMEIVSRQRFNTSDVSVLAQVQRIQAASPQAVIAWSTGGAIAGIFKALIQSGLDVPVLTGNGNMANEIMAQFAGFLPKQLYVPVPAFLPHDGLYTLDPRVEEKQKQFYAATAAAGIPVDYMSAGVWDTLLMTVAALNKLGPLASAAEVRDFLAAQTEFAGINGLYDFVRVPQRGLDRSSASIAQWDAGAHVWRAVSLPGGDPITH